MVSLLLMDSDPLVVCGFVSVRWGKMCVLVHTSMVTFLSLDQPAVASFSAWRTGSSLAELLGARLHFPGHGVNSNSGLVP